MSKNIINTYLHDIYQAALFFNNYFVGKEIIYKTQNEEISIFFNKNNFMHLCGITYPRGANAFFDAVLNHKIEQEKIVLKKDGTTLLKLKLLKYIPLIISKKVTLSNGGTYLNLNFDKAINTKSNKNKLAITLIEDNFKYKPNSLIDRTKINKFPHGNEVTAIKSIDLRTKRRVILYAKFNKIFKI